MTPRIPRKPHEYKVGWICALKHEKHAAILMLENQYPQLKLPAYDENQYFYGDINGHNVVIACMPSVDQGKASAAQTATFFSRSFPSIKIYLFVGIGGGVPVNPHCYESESKKQIHLGDVVVSSQPAKGVPAVVDYDFGMEEHGGFTSKSLLDKPRREIILALETLETQHEIPGIPGGHPFYRHLERLSRQKMRDKTKNLDIDMFKHPGLDKDVLFNPTYNRSESEEINAGQIIRTGRERETTNPSFHRGPIASGDKVIMDATRRDKLSKDCHGAICFEMEAAGIMDRTHCLIIRGIADYADSHKNHEWANYSAGTAAAFARELLHVLRPLELTEFETRPLSSYLPPQASTSSTRTGPAPTQEEPANIATQPQSSDSSITINTQQGAQSRRGRVDSDAGAKKTNSVVTLQPVIINELSPAMKWASKYDKDAIREAYLANNSTGKGAHANGQSNGNGHLDPAGNSHTQRNIATERDLPSIPLSDNLSSSESRNVVENIMTPAAANNTRTEHQPLPPIFKRKDKY